MSRKNYLEFTALDSTDFALLDKQLEIAHGGILNSHSPTSNLKGVKPFILIAIMGPRQVVQEPQLLADVITETFYNCLHHPEPH